MESRHDRPPAVKPNQFAFDEPVLTGSSSLFPADRQVPESLLDFCELRKLVTIAQVLDLIEWRPVSRRGEQLRGHCPIHKSTGERSRIFSVNLTKHAFQCFKCGETGNHLDLYAKVTGLPIYDAGLDLCRRLRITPPLIPRR